MAGELREVLDRTPAEIGRLGIIERGEVMRNINDLEFRVDAQ